MLGRRTEPLPVEAVRDLLGLARAVYRAEREAGAHPGRLARLERVGRMLTDAIELAATSSPETVGARAAWAKAEDAARMLGDLVDPLGSAESIVGAAMRAVAKPRGSIVRGLPLQTWVLTEAERAYSVAMPTHAEVLAYAERIKVVRPDITRADMAALLEAKFVHGKDVFASLGPVAVIGAIANPYDWLKGLGLIVRGIVKLVGLEKPDVGGVADIIKGVLVIVTPETPSGPE